ncbi:MAG: AAA family ATPase [Candidatus Woesearchaeota archaeon]
MIQKYTMLIAVTGTPGTGKTTYAKILAQKIQGKYINGNTLIKKYNLAEKKDSLRNCVIVNERKFAQSVAKTYNEIMYTFKKRRKNQQKERIKRAQKDTQKEPIIIIDSHLSHHTSSKIITLCIVARCNLKTLQKRLIQRRYSALKIKENLEAEIFEICETEAQEKHKIMQCWNKRDVQKIIQEIKKIQNSNTKSNS